MLVRHFEPKRYVSLLARFIINLKICYASGFHPIIFIMDSEYGENPDVTYRQMRCLAHL